MVHRFVDSKGLKGAGGEAECLFDSGFIGAGGGNYPCAAEVGGEMVLMLIELRRVGLRTVLVVVLGEITDISDSLLPYHDLAWSQIGQPAAVGSPEYATGMGKVLECRA